MTIMFNDFAYEVYPEDCHINSVPMNGTVFNRDNVKVHKLLKSLTQGTEAWTWIDKSKGGGNAMKFVRDHYDVSSKGERHMNITKAELKDL